MLPAMPPPGMRWRLITINTKNSWHHGSPRGFRSRKHRIHSSGDYRNPPPVGEHAGLYIDRLLHSDEKVVLRREIRAIIGAALVEWLKRHGYRVLAVSVSSDHAHILIELIDDPAVIKRVIGEAKRVSSRAVKSQLPGAVWSAGCDYAPIDDADRLRNEVDYVLLKQGRDSWTWSFRDGARWCEQRVARACKKGK
jgi:REP element-mobilizing transposase RayT